MERFLNINKKNFIFNLILLIKIFAVIFLVPSIQEQWFINFISDSINNPSLDPWSNYLANNGDPLGFPYGPIMIIIFLPLSLIFKILGTPFNIEDYSLGIGFRITILLFDLIGFLVLSKLLVNKKKEIIFFYWFSPLIFYVSFIFGQLDIIPTTILLAAYLFLNKNNFKLSGLFFGLAISTKLSVALIIPFPIIYLLQNKRLISGFKPFIKSLSFILALFVVTPIFSSGYREMVLGTPQKASLLWLNLPLGIDTKIFILPITFLIIIYSMWRIKRSNFTLLLSVTGLAFLFSTLMMPPSPGWYLWALPFLIIYQIRTDLNGKLLITLFTILPILIIFPNNLFSSLTFIQKKFEYNTTYISTLNQNLIYTFFISLGLIIALRLYRETTQNNDYFKLSRKAVAIGISGGPSSGKNKISNAIREILGNKSSAIIEEKDYMKWNQNSEVFYKRNFLNIQSNDLLRLNSDLNLILNKNILSRKSLTNTFNRINYKLFDKDFIIVNGYHLFLPNSLNNLFDIKIFLDPEYKLNKNWYLDKEKDSNINKFKKGYESINKFKSLYSQQKNSSDLIFEFSYINEEILNYKSVKNLPLKMDVYLKDGMYAENLSKALISICGVKLSTDISNTNCSAKLSIEGDIWSEDIKLAASRLVPNLEEIIDSKAKWHSDTLGLMQLIVIMQISYFFKYKQ